LQETNVKQRESKES